jgi:hypothetical protein
MKHISLDSRDPAIKQFAVELSAEANGAVLELNGRPIACVLPAPQGNGDVENWTEAKNTRRCQLVDREIDGTLTPEERIELHQLQQEMLRHRRRVAPLPLEDARALHQQLLARATAETHE